jgi:HPt (histidine-containing phosphotransfer) domain-containing protein
LSLDNARFREMASLFDDGDFYEEMLRPFLSQTQIWLEDLERSLARGDVAATAAIAHTIKGSALNLGFVDLGERARVLEGDARNGDLRSFEAAKNLKHEIGRIALFVERYGRQGEDLCRDKTSSA